MHRATIETVLAQAEAAGWLRASARQLDREAGCHRVLYYNARDAATRQHHAKLLRSFRRMARRSKREALEHMKNARASLESYL